MLLIPGRDFHFNPSRGGVYVLCFERTFSDLYGGSVFLSFVLNDIFSKFEFFDTL